ncbi:hypothetical protein AFI02nite_11420 [Aliivibrio fischeri]|uniref:Uncharacterized protein n=1 Tax=Aliivibrio fischeri TaxID=668 RepID=A0A510UEY4_ALIFS|nr:hypothetical protein AFI02nite_11420 [Aliivibrio fischeri]
MHPNKAKQRSEIDKKVLFFVKKETLNMTSSTVILVRLSYSNLTFQIGITYITNRVVLFVYYKVRTYLAAKL